MEQLIEGLKEIVKTLPLGSGKYDMVKIEVYDDGSGQVSWINSDGDTTDYAPFYSFDELSEKLPNTIIRVNARKVSE